MDGQRGQGGASRRAGGRDERPPEFSSPSAADASRRWIPPSSVKRDAHNPDDKNDAIFRKVRGILNKLAPEKFDKLSLELLNVGIDTQIILKGIILLIFEKALDEPKYSFLYAQLCHRLCEDAPNFEPPTSNITTFRRLLLNKCQDEFENRKRATEVFDRHGPLTPEEEEQLSLAKRKMLGNIKFIGELGKLEMLHEGILHKCIKQLLEKKKHVQVKDMAEDLECLCQIMRTVGRRLDTDKAKAWMDKYFERMKSFRNQRELPSRIRFMLQDVVELRASKWQPRKIMVDQGPKTIQQVREDAARAMGNNLVLMNGSHMTEDFGVYYPPPNMQGQRSLFGGRSVMNGSPGPRGGMTDVFGTMPQGVMGTGSIGTGPGVIHVDNFTPAYSTNMGRLRGPQQNQGQYGGQRWQQDNGSPKLHHQNHHQSQSHPNKQQQQQQQSRDIAPRDLPPRFMKNAGRPGESEISLRPAKNFNLFKPGSPNNLPKSAQPQIIPTSHQMAKLSLDPPLSTNPLLPTKQITIKQVPAQEKAKPPKKTPSKQELKQATENMVTKYMESANTEEAVTAVKEMGAPKKFMSELLSYVLEKTIVKSDEERDNASKLIHSLKEENLICAENFMEGFNNLLDQLSTLEAETPLVKSYVAKFAAQAVGNNIISLVDLSEPMESGAHYPLFLLCLQQLHKLKDKDWLVKAFQDSKLNLQNMLPECDRNKDRMMEILEDRGLSFMFPLLRVQSDLWKRIKADPNPGNIYKWIKENVDPDLHTSLGFINVLTTNILRYITSESTLKDGLDPNTLPEKHVQEKEKELLEKYKGILQMFLNDRADLQVVAIYAMQVLCHSYQFPKGMLLRFFMHFYDMEVIEEDAFLRWKEEVNDEYAGKGKALFQVNQWLTWLEQAEEESEEEEGNED